jgi:hypothetical protein
MRIFRSSLFAWLIFGAFILALLYGNALGLTHAQEEATETPTSEPSETPTPSPTPHSLTVFRDADTFTLYAPEQGEISLVGLAFVMDDESYSLENFGAFRGLPYNRVPTPICFRLARAGANIPLAQDCATALILTQALQNADVFWYDSVLVQDFVVLIQRDGETQGICASGQVECTISFWPREELATPTATKTSTETATATYTKTLVETPTVAQKINMILVPNFLGIAVFDQAHQGAEEAHVELQNPGTLEFLGPTVDNSVAGQIEIVTTAASSDDINAIMISNNAGDQLVPALQAAKGAGKTIGRRPVCSSLRLIRCC